MKLIDSLQNPVLFDHPIEKFEVIETHISQVLLTGQYVYKIKKPVNFGFLDFSTLDKRNHYCEEELRLNRRLAPQLYLDVVSIHGKPDNPNLKGKGAVIEYAVKMQQFPQSAQLDRVLKENKLLPIHIDKLAQSIANFHMSIDGIDKNSPYGDPSHISEPVLENFQQIRNCISDSYTIALLEKLEDWSKQQLEKLHDIFIQRKSGGFIRPCHGDMHLRNMALLNEDNEEHIVIFDCIEFNTNFYLIDVMSEIAFLVMDLEDRQQSAFASRFLNFYLELTGDYAGLAVFNFYKVYRAMVRAKVNALRCAQESTDTTEYKNTFQDFMQYLKLATTYIRISRPALFINHGLSGSGKSVGTRKFVELLPAIALRSDVERKRLFAYDARQHKISDTNSGIYSPQATELTYQHLVKLAQAMLISGYSVIIDAANLKQSQRQLFYELATDLSMPFTILNYQASPDTLRRRVNKRLISGQDASDATVDILEYQLTHHEPLSVAELELTTHIDTETAIDFTKLALRFNSLI